MAPAEKKHPRSARWRSVVLVLAIAALPPVLAQDEAAPEQEARDEAQPVERAFIRATADAGALAQRYPHMAEWLEPEDAPRVLALVEREAAEAPKGAMVILADEGQSANDPLLEALRTQLTEAGWAAMTLGFEQGTPTLHLARQRLAASSRPANEEAAPDDSAPVMIDVNDQAAEHLLAAHRKEMNALLASAVAWFSRRDYPQVVLVGVGRGAGAIADYLPDAPDEVSGAAWIAAEFGARDPAAIAEGLSAGGGRPVLDLYGPRDPDGRARRSAFRRLGGGGYEALVVTLATEPGRRDAGAITNRLLGWAR